MPTSTEETRTFSYVASTLDGEPFRGTIDAPDAEQASRKLRALQLQVVELTVTTRPRPAQLRGDDFFAFNQQLAQLATTGLPIEEGLRLIAEDMRSGRLAGTLREIADDLKSGKSLPQAIESHRTAFPPLYARLMDAGIRAGNLPGTLFNLGRHLTLVRQLRAAIWRTAAYPLIVLAAAFGLLVFVSFVLLPMLEPTFAGFNTDLPLITEIVLDIAAFIRSPIFWIVLAALLLTLIIVWSILRFTGKDRDVSARIGLALPLIGPVLHRSLISRWCDAMRLGIEAGLDLPASIELAGDVINSPALRHDGQQLIAMLVSGSEIMQARPGQALPLTVVRSIQIASQRNDLPDTLSMLAEMYQDQARARLESLRGLLTPFLLIIVGLVIGFIALAMIAPLISLIETVSSQPRTTTTTTNDTHQQTTGPFSYPV